ncbi:MAG TPA: hypothetical protein GX010_01990 [Erysipelotrichaceae bacterium]|nr:hypothetical protein [Erysipelotrichaceae bacterium]
MAKKRKRSKANFSVIALITRIVVFALLVGTLFVPFSNGLKMTVEVPILGNVVSTYKPAFAFMFGGELVSENATFEVLNVSAIALIGYLLIAISAALLLVSFILKNNKKMVGGILLFAAFACVLTGSILMFCSHESLAAVLAGAMIGGEPSANEINTALRNTTLEFGIWGVGMFGIISAVGLVVSYVFDGPINKILK